MKCPICNKEMKVVDRWNIEEECKNPKCESGYQKLKDRGSSNRSTGLF
jgi:Zn-finger nucleic acid-binding protein